MGERTAGVRVGGIIALIGVAYSGFAIVGILFLNSIAGMMTFMMIGNAILMLRGEPSTGILMVILTSLVTPSVPQIYVWLILVGTAVASIFSISLIYGSFVKGSAVILLIAGILSILPILVGQYLYSLQGVLEILGAIIALATGALR